MTITQSIVALALQAVVMAPLALLTLDIVAHRHVERLGGVNMWGYRGPVLRQLQPDEIRLAVVGGDLAFGWGVAASETLANGLRQLVTLDVDKPGTKLQPVVAVNLGAAGLPLDDYAAWIDRYADLRPRVICIVVDPIGHRNTARWQLPDRRSAILHATGYSPILPVVLEEKGAIVGSRALQAAGRVAAALDRSIGPNLRDMPELSATESAAALDRSVGAALAIARGVVVVFPPYSGDRVGADIALQTSVADTFAADRRVRIVALGDAVEMYGTDTTLDGFHWSAAGHGRAAAVVAPAVLSLLGR